MNDKELAAHFESVREAQRAKSGGGDSIQIPDMEENELTRGLRR